METFPCTTCGLVLASVNLLQEHIISHNPQTYPCTKCNDMLFSEASLILHLASSHAENDDILHPEHDTPHEMSVPAPSNIKCEQCSFVAVDDQAILVHMQNDHVEEPCHYCEHVANDRDDLKDHMYEKHEDVIMVHTMAQQMNQISESFSLFETFKTEISDVLRTLLNNQNNVLHNQNSMKQEMFLIRNKQLEHTNQAKPSSFQPTDEPAPAAPSSQSSGQPCPPPASSSDQSPPLQSTSKIGNKKVPKPPQKKVQPKTLYIGVSSNVDIGALEEATQTQFVTAKAYSSVHDTEKNVVKEPAKYPESNFNDTIPKELKKADYQTLILQAGSVDITNLNTKDDPTKHMEYFRPEAVLSIQCCCLKAAADEVAFREMLQL